MAITKDGTNYRYDFQIGGYRFRGTTGCADAGDAKAVEAAKKIEAGRLVDHLKATASRPLTVQAACARWWSEHGQHLKDSSLEALLKRMAAAFPPGLALHDLTDDHISRLVQARRRDTKRDGRDADGAQLYRQVSPRTVNKTVMLLRQVLRRARDNWNAAVLREPVWHRHFLKEPRRPVRELSGAEEAILDGVEDADFSDLRRFAIITGLRRREVLLTWPQVDFDNALVRIIAKGGTFRQVPLSQAAYAILWARRGDHPVSVFTFVAQRTRRCPKSDQQFIRGRRYPISYFGIGSNKRKWRGAGVDARIHDLRHTAGMRTLRATGNLKVTQELLGHSDIAITAKFYTTALIGDVRAAMETTAAAHRDQVATAPRQIAKKID